MAIQAKIDATDETAKPASVTGYALQHVDRAAKCTFCNNGVTGKGTWRCSGEKTRVYPCNKCVAEGRPCRVKISNVENIIYYGELEPLVVIHEHGEDDPYCCYECDL